MKPTRCRRWRRCCSSAPLHEVDRHARGGEVPRGVTHGLPYEAVRRGCRDIVVVDASCDPDRNYDDLGNAIRKIRIDLGVRIERAGPLRIGPRELQAEGRYCALFDVIYDDTRSGSLLYIKTAVYPKAENMPIDVLQRILLLVNPLIGSSVRRTVANPSWRHNRSTSAKRFGWRAAMIPLISRPSLVTAV